MARTALGVASAIVLGCACTGASARELLVGAGPSGAGVAVRTDGSRCEHESRPDREVSETAGMGAFGESVRRVYRLVGQGNERRRVLACREVDTNLDGIKDLVRSYDLQGQPVEERADADYDGATDTWIRFENGRVVQVEVDDAWDGAPDESRHYADGKLTRIERDTNSDGRPDIWEIYLKGRLDRMGVDIDYDGRVDRWSRDASTAPPNKGRTGSAPLADMSDKPKEN